jgi:hypothetical protein
MEANTIQSAIALTARTGATFADSAAPPRRHRSVHLRKPTLIASIDAIPRVRLRDVRCYQAAERLFVSVPELRDFLAHRKSAVANLWPVLRTTGFMA